MRNLLLISLLLHGYVLLAQPPHDACALARPLAIGDYLVHEDNRLASIEEDVLPAIQPVTCIKTYENDLWYTFTTTGEYQYYNLRVDPFDCETPAGLQMLVIKADSCDPATFSYTACVNPYSVTPLELFWENPVPGETYLLQVDGYDGNICAFSIKLEGFAEDMRTEQDLRRMRSDPMHPEPTFTDAGLASSFINNAVVLQWQASTRENISFFLVEKVYFNADSTLSGAVIGVVEPTNLVGDQVMADYQFTIEKGFADERRYCYQIVKVDVNLSMAYSEASCVMTDLVEDFFISNVFPYEKGDPGVYAINYINRKRQDLDFSVLDAEGNYLKGYTRKREPVIDGVITIDMSSYPPGEYLLKVEGKRGSYQRPFVIK